MSVNVTTYVIYGALLPYPKHLDDAEHEFLWENHGAGYWDEEVRAGLSYISDGMDGAWCAVGKVFARSWRDDCGALPRTFSIPRTKPVGVQALVAEFVDKHNLNTDPHGYQVGWHVLVDYS